LHRLVLATQKLGGITGRGTSPWYARAMLRALRRRQAAKRERKLREYAEEAGHMEPAELQRLRDLQSPVRAKWGFYPK
jgi:hypothetical protein